MAKFNKVETVKGKIAGIIIKDGNFVDFESGENVNVVGMLSKIYKDRVFDIATTSKEDTELDT